MIKKFILFTIASGFILTTHSTLAKCVDKSIDRECVKNLRLLKEGESCLCKTLGPSDTGYNPNKTSINCKPLLCDDGKPPTEQDGVLAGYSTLFPIKPGEVLTNCTCKITITTVQ